LLLIARFLRLPVSVLNTFPRGRTKDKITAKNEYKKTFHPWCSFLIDIKQFNHYFSNFPFLIFLTIVLERNMAWFYLFMAGIMEIIWSYCMKESAGFTRILPTVICITTMVASVVLLALAMKNLPLGTAYTIWTGIGAVGAFLVGLLVLGEPASSLRLFAALLIVTGLVLMKWAS